MSYISPQKVFAHLDRLAAWNRGETPAPVTVEIDLTNVCSLGCQSCHFAHTHVAGPWAARPVPIPAGYDHTGKFASAALVRRALGEMAEAGVKGIVWSGGGEPTLHPRLTEIVAHAHALGLQQGMYTLGGHITPQTAAWTKHLSWAVVSLDCADAESYAAEKGVPASRFQAACDGIQSLALFCPVVGVSFLLHAGNWQRMADMVALARNLGATYTTFRPTIQFASDQPSQITGDRTWIAEALPSLQWWHTQPNVEVDPSRFEEYRDWASHGYAACKGPRLVTMVTPDGRVWVCPNRRGMAGSELGDLRRESFAEVWARHPRQWTVDSGCRAMCRLHLVNRTLETVHQPRAHEAFV